MGTARRMLGLVAVLAAVTAAGCGGDDASVTDGGAGVGGSDAAVPIDGSDPCTEDSDCDDGLYCNGAERCDDSQCVRGAVVDCDDGVACTDDICSNASGSCRHLAPDLDGDGHTDANCLDQLGVALGDDCDDENAARQPGSIEVCDEGNVDEDCDPATLGERDQDLDGVTDHRCCNTDAAGTLQCGADCDDFKPSVKPTAPEVCDLYDNDCDGETDEDAARPMYPDDDFDGHGAIGVDPELQCPGTLKYSEDQLDCDDSDPTVHQLQAEICDGQDNDCDLRMDESPVAVLWYADEDGDGFGGDLTAPTLSCAPVADHTLLALDCNDRDAAIHPAAAEACDGVDNNCDLRKSFRLDTNDFEDDDGDGSADFGCDNASADDCDDNDKSVGGSLTEICDHLDNDCDDIADEGVADTVWYLDEDGDGYGNERLPAVVYCAPLSGRSAYPGDCNDADPTINPGAFEVCSLTLSSGVDENCNGRIDEGNCTVCGDGVIEGAEQCDERAVSSFGVCVDPDRTCNSDTRADACRTDCLVARCGDGVIDTGEVCDDGAGNSPALDTCDLDCTAPEVVCGDGVVAGLRFGEPCEPGVGLDGDICRSDCSYEGWLASGCSVAVPTDLGSAVGAVVSNADTGSGGSEVVINPDLTPNLCAFSGDPPMGPEGPELLYAWQPAAALIYGFTLSGVGQASRLSLGVFWDGAHYATSCTDPLSCLEPVSPNQALLTQFESGDRTILVVDSESAQTFTLTIRPLLCCATGPGTDLDDLGGCQTANSQADQDCALAAAVSAVGPQCLTRWSAACVAAADAACSYTCP